MLESRFDFDLYRTLIDLARRFVRAQRNVLPGKPLSPAPHSSPAPGRNELRNGGERSLNVIPWNLSYLLKVLVEFMGWAQSSLAAPSFLAESHFAAGSWHCAFCRARRAHFGYVNPALYHEPTQLSYCSSLFNPVDVGCHSPALAAG